MMIRQKYDAFIDGISIRSVSPLVRVTGINEIAPQIETESEPFPGASGQIIFGQFRRQIAVQISFVVAEIFDLAARAAAIEAVNGWAKAGNLELSYRPDRILRVDAVTERPAVSKIKDYTAEYTLTLTAYAFPFWVDATQTQKTGTGNSASITMRVPGNRQAYLEGTIVPASDTLTDLTISCTNTGTQLIVSGCSVSSETEIVLSYSAQHFQLLTANGIDLRPYIDPSSTDHVLLDPDTANTITFSTDTVCQYSLTTRGVYA